jgi:hypothetical protein
MSQGHWHIKPSEIRRIIETVKQSGLHVRTVEVNADGFKITVSETVVTTDPQNNTNRRSEWD